MNRRAYSIRATGPAKVSGDLLTAANDDDLIFLSNEGRNLPICDVDSVIGCTVIGVLFLVVLVTAPDWWPVLVGVL
jgi:hypothetical protein